MLKLFGIKTWWARQGLNLRPHPCEGCALPLSYAPAPKSEGAPLVRRARIDKTAQRSSAREHDR